MSDKLIFRVICDCGWWADVDEAEAGQSLGGTAAEKAARHDGRCQMDGAEAKTTPVFVDGSRPSHMQQGGVEV